MSESLILNVEPLLNERQVAEITGMSVRSLQTWRLRGGGPPYVKLGTAVRYRRGDIHAWLQCNLRSSTSDRG